MGEDWSSKRLLVSDWQRIEPLVDAALDSAPDAREAVIRAVCQGDESEMALVRAFVCDCDTADPVLDKPAIESFAAILEDEHGAPSLPEIVANRYRIEDEIGVGGMAVVYRAHDAVLDRRVALKVIKRIAHSPNYARRFFTEIHTTARLTHPHIVPVFDSGEADSALFFVMPYCDGGSLAERLERPTPLELDEALRIGSDIASALDYAHAAGFVHRDIKPSNILFSGGSALLADFGIARGIGSEKAKLTASGFVLGTPDYMSPEHQAGAKSLDGRSDIYSFACVVYEMIGGESAPPAAHRVALARRGIDPVVPLDRLRPELPPATHACVLRAMSLSANERYQSATEFIRALAASMPARLPEPKPSRSSAFAGWRSGVSLSVMGAAAIVLSALGAYAFKSRSANRAMGAPPVAAHTASPPTSTLDSTQFVVLPYEEGDTSLVHGSSDGLIDALQRWQGVSIADRYRLKELIARVPNGHLQSEDARRISRELGAGRFIRRRIVNSGATSTVTASLYNAEDGTLLREASAPLLRHQSSNDSAFSAIAGELLFDTKDADPARLTKGTRSRVALQLFEHGAIAIRQWELVRAESAFVAASHADSGFAAAHLRAAQVRVWRGLPTAAWRIESERAYTQRARLPASDRLASEIVQVYARGDTATACSRWNASAAGSEDFAAWYSAALCEMRDGTVLRDRTSPSGWRFRSSYAQSLRALRRASELLPMMHREFRTSLYWDLGTTLNISSTQIRTGFAQAPDTGTFEAYASWSVKGDSLQFIPMRIAAFMADDPRVIPATLSEAVHRQRLVFKEMATVWHNVFPRNADAMLALSVALDELNDLSALDSVAVARSFAVDSGEVLRAAATEVWLRTKHGVPSNLASLQTARALADSILRQNPAPRGATVGPLSALAMLVGHVAQAAALTRVEQAEDDLTPGTLRATAQGLLVFAAAGGPLDSLARLAKEVESTIVGTIDAQHRGDVRARWLARAVSLSFPTWQTPLVRELSGARDVLVAAEGAWLRHDNATALAYVRGLRERRSPLRAEDVKLEAAYPEAWLIAALGDTTTALERISASLDVVNRSSAQRLSDVVGAGSLLRAMALRSQLEHARGNSLGAAQWANAVLTLWGGADRELQQTLFPQMRILAR